MKLHSIELNQSRSGSNLGLACRWVIFSMRISAAAAHWCAAGTVAGRLCAIGILGLISACPRIFAAADLIPQGVSATSPVTAGNAVTVSYTVRNQGNTNAPASHTKVQIKSSSGTEVASQVFSTIAISAMSSTNESRSVMIPSTTPAGTYTAYAIVDNNSEVAQNGATANDYSSAATFTVQAAAATAADLLPQSITATSPVAAGNAVTVAYTIRNQGGTNAPASHTKIQIKNSSGTEVASQTYSTVAINANSSTDESHSVTIPSTASAGTYNAYVIVDNNTEVAQGGATGNDLSSGTAFTVQAAATSAADLLPQSITATSPVTAGNAVTVAYRIRNQGGTNAPASHTKIQVKNSSGTEVASQTYTTVAISANSSTDESHSLIIPSTASAGTYTAYVIVDNNTEVTQGGATGNDLSSGTTFTVQAAAATAADLLPQSITATSPVIAGNAVTVAYTIRNQGGTNAPASHTKIQIKNSSGAEIAAQTHATVAISADSATDESHSLTIPLTAGAGTYTAYVIVDNNTEVAQGGATGNDLSSGTTFTVQAATATAADLVAQNVTATSPVTAGNTVTVAYTIRNQGGTNAPTSHTKIQIKNPAGTEVVAQTYATVAISANSSADESHSLTIPSTATAGVYTVYVIVDNNTEVAQGGATGNDLSSGTRFTVQTGTATAVDPTVADGFDYPVGAKSRYTGALDGDGWYVATEFNELSGTKHHVGEDWNTETGGNTDYGLPVYAVANGTIIYAGPARVSGWGNVIILRHKLPDGTQVESLYGHVATIVKTGGDVTRGDKIGTIGDGGGLYFAHLHLEIRFSNAANWGSEGTGYSVTASPAGWTDPSNFIDAHRPTSSAAATAPKIDRVSPTTMLASSNTVTAFEVIGINFSTTGGRLEFTDSNEQPYKSSDRPERIVSVTSNRWVYQLNNGFAFGTWKVKVVNADNQSSDPVSFEVNFGALGSPLRRGVDYSFTRPSASGLKNAHYDFAIRYVGGGTSKRLTLDEARSLQTAGLDVILVFEALSAERMRDGFSAGVTDANLAVSQATDAGAPANFFCYFACDYDARTASELAAVNAYLDGVATIISKARIGIYGSYGVIKSVLDSGKASKAWQTETWSGGLLEPRICLVQQAGEQSIAGGACDVDYAFTGDIGQWSAAAATSIAYQVTSGAGANGAISPMAAQNVSRGGRASFTATPASGYVVDQWLVNGTGVQSSGTTFTLENVTAPSTVAVTFKLASTNSAFASQPLNQAAAQGSSITLSAAPVSGSTGVQWQRNGRDIFAATGSTFSLNAFQPANAGLYTAVTTGGVTTVATAPAIVGASTADKVAGAGSVVGTGVAHPNGNTFDQVLLTGSGEAITADAGKVTRTSFIDLTNDIVQVEFSGAGTLSLVLDASTTPAPPVNYNQPTVSYVKGHAGIVITGATETTNLSIFSVGRTTAFDPTGRYDILKAPSATNVPANNGSSLFVGHSDTAYDGIADLAYVAISSTNGKFGGIRAANTHFFALKGITGIYAPGVAFQGPLFVGNIDAFDTAIPTLQVGSVSDARITGGDLAQDNGSAVQVTGLSQLSFTAGIDSQGRDLPAKVNRAVLQQNGQNVTAQLVRDFGGTDTTPDAFTFTDITGADSNTAYTSNQITITGINAAAEITISGGAYSINGGTFTNATGTVNNGDRVTVRLTSSSSATTKTTATLTIGGVSDAYEVTTKAATTATYSVTVSAGANGSVSPTGTQSIQAGGSLSLVATPSTGFNVNQWLVNGTVVAIGQTSYMLSNVTASGTVQVTFVAQATNDSVLASGDAKTGTLGIGARATWNMTLASGDSVVVRVGTQATGSFSPQIQIYDPSGSLVRSGSGNNDAMITFQATIGGSYAIVVSSYYSGGGGSYRLSTIKAPGSQTISAGDEGGALTNGGAYDGTLSLGDIDPWTITAAVGETLVIRLGRQTGNFAPQLLLYDPAGNQVRSVSDRTDAGLTYQASTGGTYTIVASSYYNGDTGTYRLHVVKAPGVLTVATGDEGGALTNGSAHDGTLTNGDLDPWTITAAVGETLVVRMGRQTGNFAPQLFLFDPFGNQVRSVSGSTDAEFTYQATVGGTYTVVASSYYNGDTGTYRLHAVKAPGALRVSPGDEGGTLVNGGAHEGTITNGDLDAWTISATAGETLLVRIGTLTGNLAPQLYLIDPSGNLVRSVSGSSDVMFSYQALVGGSYTVVASSYYNGDAGTYRLHAVKVPGTLSVPSGDDGGAFTPGVARDGTITIGDLDTWTITASANAQLSFQVERLTGSLTLQVYLYDTSGNLVRSNSGSSATISYQARVGGTYTVVVCGYYNGDTGTYRIR